MSARKHRQACRQEIYDELEKAEKEVGDDEAFQAFAINIRTSLHDADLFEQRVHRELLELKGNIDELLRELDE